MCDTDNNCGGGGGNGGGPPECMPAWLRCPPTLNEKNYPVPQGVEILPISQGGRNGSSKKKFKCGQCGQDKPPADTKPKASADCPMMKQRCGEGKDESKSGGFLSKIKEFFGIGKDPRLVQMYRKLQVPDEQVRHHRDVFNTQLFVGKDGYMSPFLTRVDCQEACGGQIEEDDEECECEDDEYDDYDDEECIEDEEGECILEETAECMDEDCKLFFEEDKSEDCDNCELLNSFLIRVQAPSSASGSTNETCEEIISRLTSTSKQYPEPGPRPERKKEVELVVKQITVEDSPADCPAPPKKKCKCKDKDKSKPPEPVEPKKEDPCPAPPPPPPEPVKVENPAQDVGPGAPCPELEGIPCPPPTPDECGPAEPPPPPPPNDCETLSEIELLSKALKDIKCGCPKPCPECNEGPFPGLTCYGGNGTSVWTPPPPPPCPRCGTPIRGDTDGCYLCHITRRMRSGLPEGRIELPAEFKDALDIKDTSDSCTPEYLEDGSLKYKGGMCMGLVPKFLWFLEKRNPPGGFYDRFRGNGNCGDLPPEPRSEPCSCREDRPSYKGGMNLNDCINFLQCKPPEETPPEPKRKCKTAESKPPADKCPPPPK